MTTSRAYSHQVFNENGYVLLYPNIGNEADLLQGSPPNPYACSLYQEFPLGTKLISAEKGWWYCKNAAVELAISVATQSAAAVHADHDDNIVVGATAAIGATQLYLTSSTNLAAAPYSSLNGLAEGYIFFNTGAGQGQIYKIKGNAAFSGTSSILIDLYDPLTIALTTASRAGLIQHPCANVVASKAVVTGIFTGIPQLVVTASYYFWNQMAGPAAVIGNSAVAKGSWVVIGTTAAKTDVGAAFTTEIIIGYPLTPCYTTDAESFMVNLQGNW